jgi:hypothetical protein
VRCSRQRQSRPAVFAAAETSTPADIRSGTAKPGHGSAPADIPKPGRVYGEFGCIAPTPIGMSMGQISSATEVPSDLSTLLPVVKGRSAVLSAIGSSGADADDGRDHRFATADPEAHGCSRRTAITDVS